jgi:hypothetical protein
VYFRFRDGTSEMEMIKLYSLDDYDNLPVNKWNIKQPPDDDNERVSVFDTGQEQNYKIFRTTTVHHHFYRPIYAPFTF